MNQVHQPPAPHTPHLELALAIAEAVRDALGSAPADPCLRKIVDDREQGDVTFQVDATAEEAIARVLRDRAPSVAVYTEGLGLRNVGASAPEAFLMIDPVDGSRAAAIGLNTAMVSVAVAGEPSRPTFGSIVAGVDLPLTSEVPILAWRGGGAWHGREAFSCSRGGDVGDSLFWTTEIAGRSTQDFTYKLAALIDETSRRGAMFLLNSSAFALTAVARGLLDAHVDVARPVAEFGLFTYDIAASYLILREAGGICTLPDGTSLDDVPLLDEHGNALRLSVVAARTREIQEYVRERIID